MLQIMSCMKTFLRHYRLLGTAHLSSTVSLGVLPPYLFPYASLHLYEGDLHPPVGLVEMYVYQHRAASPATPTTPDGLEEGS